MPANVNDDPMRIRLSEERGAAILAQLKDLYSAEFDEELSAYRADRVLNFFVRALGPSVYNQAIQDARKFMLEKIEDLDEEFREKDVPG